jgi:hypothetical protein
MDDAVIAKRPMQTVRHTLAWDGILGFDAAPLASIWESMLVMKEFLGMKADQLLTQEIPFARVKEFRSAREIIKGAGKTDKLGAAAFSNLVLPWNR